MPINRPPAVKKAEKAAIGVVVVIAFIIVAIFIGFNVDHARTQHELKSGRVDPRDAPKTSTDLQAPRPRQK